MTRIIRHPECRPETVSMVVVLTDPTWGPQTTGRPSHLERLFYIQGGCLRFQGRTPPFSAPFHAIDANGRGAALLRAASPVFTFRSLFALAWRPSRATSGGGLRSTATSQRIWRAPL